MERFLLCCLGTGSLVLIGLSVWVAVLMAMPMSFVFLLVLFLSIVCLVIGQRIYRKILAPFFRLANNIESIRADDFSLYNRNPFRSGVCTQVFDEMSILREELRLKKRRFDERIHLVYSLTEQLESPVLVLDQHRRLVHANPAFSLWYGQEWRIIRLTKANKLGLSEKSPGQWQLRNSTRSEGSFQIRSSRFPDNGGEHQLLLMTDISKEMRHIQQVSWQQVIRVLGHEISNSLTPIKSLAQTLATITEGEQYDMVKIILERSESLNNFVRSYANTYRRHPLSLSSVALNELFTEISLLLPEIKIISTLGVKEIVADPDFFKQVVINLIKNAIDVTKSTSAKTNPGNGESEVLVWIEVDSWRHSDQVFVSIADFGGGIQNPENLFVPFYTTKPQGQGIGLSFSRHIIEQHGGVLTLKNRDDKKGAVATLALPDVCI